MIEALKQELKTLLQDNILRFWLTRMADKERGGFYGRCNGHNHIVPDAPKGAILNARILWTFSAAYRVLGHPEYLEAATRAKDYFLSHFIDHDFGGVYWSLDAGGNPLDDKKQTYAIAFAIYGLSEYARTTGDTEAKQWAISLYKDIEGHAYDDHNNGYVEALTRQWDHIADMRLSDKDENGSRTMNTHLHVIEAYTNLLRIWPDEELRRQTHNLLNIFLVHIVNPHTHHLDLFFDDNWQGKRNIQSYGHDIEASWLLHETASVLGENDFLCRVESEVKAIARAADEGLQTDGAMIYEYWTDSGLTDTQRQWWVECECVVGHINLFAHFKDQRNLDIALRCWQYIKTHLVDYEQGEWFWGCDADGLPDTVNDKAGFWKCPYHNSRMCLEIIQRNFN